MHADRPELYAPKVVVYTRQGCHLCDDAIEFVQKFVSDVTLVDIDQQEELVEKFNTCVPVVEIDGKIRFRGRVHPRLFRRLMVTEGYHLPEHSE